MFLLIFDGCSELMNDAWMNECGVGAPLFLPKTLCFICRSSGDRSSSLSMCNRVAPRPVRGFGERQCMSDLASFVRSLLRFSFIAGGEGGDVCVRMAPEVP